MKLLDTVRRAGRSLRQAKARTLLTSLAIAVGAFTITLSLAAGAGGRQYTEDLVSANTNVRELQIQQKQPVPDGLASSSQSTPQEYREDASFKTFGAGYTYKQLTQADIDKIAAVDGVESVQPAYTLDAKYVTRPGQKKYQAMVNMFNQGIQQEYVAGSADSMPKNGVVITEEYRNVLGFTNDQAAIGQTIDLVASRDTPTGSEEKTFQLVVVAVYKSSLLSFTNGTALQLSPDVAKQLYDFTTEGQPSHGQYFVAGVRTKANVSIDDMKAKLSDMGYDVRTAKDLMGAMFNFINVLQGILLGFGGLAVLTSIFGIINTQYISVLERTQQIGLMKALGMRRRDVGRLFKLEAAWIGFLGGAIGSVLAIVAGVIANPFITKALTLEEGTRLLIFEPFSVVIVVGGLMLVAITAGILPARKAAKLDPIEALRTE